MIRCRNIAYLGYGIVDTTTGGKCEIWTHGTLLFFGFQDRCNKPDSANFPCGIPSMTRTYRNWILSPVCLPVSSWGYGAVDRIRTYEAISDRFTVCCLYPSWLQRHGSWGKTMIARCYENYPRINATLHRHIIQSPQGLQSGCLLVRIRLYSSAVDVYTLRCFTHFNDCGF